MPRIYGHEKTHLTLTEKAENLYSSVDPLKIIEEEYEEDGEKKYRYFAFILSRAMTEEQINSFLESFHDLHLK